MYEQTVPLQHHRLTFIFTASFGREGAEPSCGNAFNNAINYQGWLQNSLVPRPRPALPYCKRRKAGRGLGTRLAQKETKHCAGFVASQNQEKEKFLSLTIPLPLSSSYTGSSTGFL